MVRRRYQQLTLAQVVLFGVVVPEIATLMDPKLRRIDLLLDDEALVDEKSDTGLLVPSIEEHLRVFGRAPRVVATDRGFHSTQGELRAGELGVRHAIIPKPGYRSRERIGHERQRWFRRGRAWRSGGEARIGRLKNVFGMARSLCHGRAGMERTVFWAAIANNLVAIAR